MHDETPATPAKSDKNLKEFYANTQKDSLSWKFAGVHIDARVTRRVSSANLGADGGPAAQREQWLVVAQDVNDGPKSGMP